MTELQSVLEPPASSMPVPVATESMRQAYEMVRERIAKVPEENMPHISLDIPTVVTTVLGALKQVRGLRPDIVRAMPSFDLSDIDQLENYAYAVAHLHTSWIFAANLPELLPELIQRATVLRDILISQVSTLSKLNLIDGSVLDDLKGAVGHRNLAVDMAGMAGVLRQSWSKLNGKVSVTLAELDEAEKLTKSIFEALSQRERAVGEQVEINRERQRAYKLLIDTYDQARRAIAFLRWNEGDLDRFVPSLFAGRGPKRKSEPEGEAPAAATNSAATPTPTAIPQSAVPVGHPNSEPFINA